jgi:sugar lactone lactonase YvrE
MTNTRKFANTLISLLLGAVVGVVIYPPDTAAAAGGPAPEAQHVLFLPDGYTAEGIAINDTTATFYADSHVTGDIYAGNLFTGRGRLLVHDTVAGEQAYGVSIDPQGRLWVAYGATGQIRVFDPRTGRRLATYQVGPRNGSGLINDLLVTPNAVYATDSVAQQLYVLPLPGHGRLPGAGAGRVVRLVGDIHYSPTGRYDLPFNANGIQPTPDGRALLIDQTNAGLLFRVDPRTGVTRTVRLSGGDLAFADGLHRIGTVLYVAQNDSGQVAEVVLAENGSTGRIVAHPTATRPYQRPAALAVFDGRMYVSQMISLDPYRTPDRIDSFPLPGHRR